MPSHMQNSKPQYSLIAHRRPDMRTQVASQQLSLGLEACVRPVFCIYCRRRAGQFVDGRYECTRCGERTLFTRREYERLIEQYGPEGG